MKLGPAWVWWLIGGGLLAALIFGGVVDSCGRQRDKPGQRADSVLADTAVYVQRIRDQDSTIAGLEKQIERTEVERDRWKGIARITLARVDSAQQAADSTVAAGVPDSVELAVFWKDQWEVQRRLSAKLRSETVPALLATIAADSVGIAQRDEYGREMRSQRDFARERANLITSEFRRYREESKPGIDLGLFRVPEWVGYAAVAAGAATVTAIAVK